MTYPHKSKRQLRHELRVKVEKEREIMKKIQPLEKELYDLQNGIENEQVPRRRKA